MNDEITVDRLMRALGLTTALALVVAPVLEAAAKKHEICGQKSRAAFIAQLAHESADFTRTVENLNYSAKGLVKTWPSRFRFPDAGEAHLERFEDGKLNATAFHRQPEKIANHVYANRMGNGPPESGDGWRFRGRGYIQITGRAMYSAYTVDSGVDVVAHPELLELPEHAAASAAWFWNRIGGCRYVKDGDFEGLTRKINGGLIGLDDRLSKWEATEAVFA